MSRYGKISGKELIAMAAMWTEKQKKAIDKKGCNILVSAAAGSGKTAVLVERIIKKITDKENPVDIDRLIVVTFTKAAAAEMKSRIRNALDEMIESQPESSALQMQLTLLNNAQITTIDSFCLNIVRNYFSDIDIDPGFRIADTGEIQLLESDVLSSLLEDEYAARNHEFFDMVDAYGTGRDDSKIEELITKIYKAARSYPWEDEWYDECIKLYEIDDESALEQNAAVQYLLSDIKSAVCGFDLMYDDIEKVCQSAAGPLKYLPAVTSDHILIKKLMQAESIVRLSEIVSDSSFDKLGTITKKDDVNPEKQQYVKERREEFKTYINKKLKTKLKYDSTESVIKDIKVCASHVTVLIRLAKEFSRRMSEEKRNRNIIDFNDMEHMALDILVKRENGKINYTKVSDALSEFYEEILIDEYQDSNLLQENILTAISKGKEGKGENNIYMVGDVKQSIYKFRLACPELFMEKYDRYTSGDSDCIKIELQTNFRSRANVLETANDVFFRLMNKDFCGIEYDDCAKLNPGLTYPECEKSVLINNILFDAVSFENDTTDIRLIDMKAISESESSDAEDKSDYEAAEAVNIIKELVDIQPGKPVHMVYDKNSKGGYRPISYSDIVILTRSKTGYAKTFVNTLMDSNIPAYSDASEGYFEVREIQIVLNFLTVIDNPLQDIPMAAVLLSYFGGFDERDLTVIRSKDKKEKLYNQLKAILGGADHGEVTDRDLPDNAYDAELVNKVHKFMKILDKYRQVSELVPIYDLLWKVLYETGYYDYVKTMPAGQRRQANLDLLLVKAAAFEGTSYNGLFNFLRYISRVKKLDVDFAEASVLSENENLVRVMTIHKSKGLEFPVVILAGMGKRFNFTDARGDVIIDRDFGVGANAVYLDKRTKKSTVIKDAVSRKIEKENISEEMRVLYVAMTRAREKLIMTGTVNDATKSLNKWKQEAEVLKRENIFSYLDCSNFQTYIDMVMPVFCMEQDLRNGNTKNSVITECSADKKIMQEQRTEEEKIFQKEPLPYPYSLDTAKKVKVTVSELKKMQLESDFDEKDIYHDDIEFNREVSDENEEIVPEFLRQSDEPAAANERGTAYHRIMECIDYGDTNDIRNQIELMLEDNKITQSQKMCISLGDIENFVDSELGKRIKAAYGKNNLFREQPFVFIDERDNSDQLIQGVIDLYIIEEDEAGSTKTITIVDYKTDRVAKGEKGEKELIKRYKVQLDYYAKALEQLTGFKVKEKIIYSFTLNKSISI